MKIFIVLTSQTLCGPVRGGIALANGLAAKFDVALVFCRSGSSKGYIQNLTDSRVKIHVLSKRRRGILEASKNIRELTKGHKMGDTVVLSMCLYADFLSLFCIPQEIPKIVSLRGNLYKNYRFDFGLFGVLVALTHYWLIRKADIVIAMSRAMKDQIKFLGYRDIRVIPNFIDERRIAVDKASCSRTAKRVVRFLFLGNMSRRKKPVDVVKAFLLLGYDNIELHMVGNGQLLNKARRVANRRRMFNSGIIIFHGYLKSPLEVSSKCDVLVLPSLSEGISRAALECLHQGLQVVMRDVDANNELIQEGRNGYLFRRDSQLSEAMDQAYQTVMNNDGKKESLLPVRYSSEKCISKYAKILESIK